MFFLWYETDMAQKNAVEALRWHLGLTQAELGEPVGTAQSEVSNLEYGRRPLSADKALAWWFRYGTVLRDLGYDLEDLLRIGRS